MTMKKIILLIFLFFGLILGVFAPVNLSNQDSRRIYFAYHRQRLIKAIIHVESKGNPKAYNTKEQAAGLMQIRPVCLKHINMISGSNYTLEDRFDSLKSIAMFDSLMVKRNPEYDADLACMLWNSGSMYPKNKRVELMVEKYKTKVLKYY